MRFSCRALFGVTLFVWALGPAHSNAQEEEKPIMVTDGHRVSIEYTPKLADGSVADTNVGGEALTYEQGASQILPALENQLLGLKVGTELLAQSPSGQPRPVRVHEVKGEEIVMDLNHPLAGKALDFDVKILAVE